MVGWLAKYTPAAERALPPSASPYHFHKRNLVVGKDGRARISTVGERERVMGFPTGYTLGATSSSAAKADPFGTFAVRASLVGNSISVFVLQWVLAQLATQLGFRSHMPTRRELREGRARDLVTLEDPGAGHSGT